MNTPHVTKTIENIEITKGNTDDIDDGYENAEILIKDVARHIQENGNIII